MEEYTQIDRILSFELTQKEDDNKNIICSFKCVSNKKEMFFDTIIPINDKFLENLQKLINIMLFNCNKEYFDKMFLHEFSIIKHDPEISREFREHKRKPFTDINDIFKVDKTESNIV